MQRRLWPAVLVTALALAGCGSATGTGPSTDGASGKLVVWDWKSSDKTAQNFVAKAKADFAKKHSGVTVEFVAQPFDKYYTLLGAAIQAGKGPDVMLFNGGGQLRERSDALLPLDEYVAQDKQRLAGWDAFTKDGKIYAAPITLQGHPIYYNKTLLPEGRTRPGEAAHHLGSDAQRLRRDQAGDQRALLLPGQQGRLSASSSGCRAWAPASSRPPSTTTGSRASGTGTART